MSDKNVSELLNIVHAGAGVTMDAIHFTAEDVMPVARACAEEKVQLYVEGAMGWRTKDLIEIAQAGGGQVVFT